MSEKDERFETVRRLAVYVEVEATPEEVEEFFQSLSSIEAELTEIRRQLDQARDCAISDDRPWLDWVAFCRNLKRTENP